jgi:hypothetical protein
MKDSTSLIPVHSSKLCPTEREVSVASRFGIVDHDVKRTIHRFQFVFNPFLKKRGIQGIIEFSMAALMPDIKLGNMGGIHDFIAI